MKAKALTTDGMKWVRVEYGGPGGRSQRRTWAQVRAYLATDHSTPVSPEQTEDARTLLADTRNLTIVAWAKAEQGRYYGLGRLTAIRDSAIERAYIVRVLFPAQDAAQRPLAFKVYGPAKRI